MSAKHCWEGSLWFAAVVVSLGSTPQPLNPNYQSSPIQAQSEPPPDRLDPIVVPTSSVPALVIWGEPLDVTVRLPNGGTVGDPQDWFLALTARTKEFGGAWVGQPVDLRFTLPVRTIRQIEPKGLYTLSAIIPAQLPRDTYHLEVAGPKGLRGRRVFAVRVLGDAERKKRFRFAVIGDHQIKDPSASMGGREMAHPSLPRKSEEVAENWLLQEIDEISFWDPDFVLYLGDLVFGIDYRQEMEYTLSKWWSHPMATFMVPGNHDGLALYKLALKEGWWLEAIQSVRCAKPLWEGEMSAEKVFGLLSCVYGDLKKILFEDLAQDGLDYWRHLLGATDYSFDLGKFHFIGVNSYSGTAERRHAFMLNLNFLGIDLGVSPVDNYGGTVTDPQLQWLQGDLERASQAGKTVVWFFHHDPRGNGQRPWGARYHSNQPFPTEPFGLRAFQEWNYDGADWDSDPSDAVAVETQTNNQALKLLRLIGQFGTYVFFGHLHGDLDQSIEAGAELVENSGIRALRKIQIARVTTGSSSTFENQDYRGYRLVRAIDGQLVETEFLPQQKLASVPAGNLWVVDPGLHSCQPSEKRCLLAEVHSGLPVPAEGMLRAYLPFAPEGYHFSAQGGEVSLSDVGRGEGNLSIYYLRVSVPPVPLEKGIFAGQEENQVNLQVQRAKGNRPPNPSFSIPAGTVYGQSVRFEASPDVDPQKQPWIQVIWDFGDGASARGQTVTHQFRSVGRYPIHLTVVDARGAFGSSSQTLVVSEEPSCGVGQTACVMSSGAILFFAMILLGLWLRSRKKIDRKSIH